MSKSHVLTSLSFGVHAPRRCQYRALLADHERKRFVIIVIREEPQQLDGRFGQALQRVFHTLWDRNNPFGWGDESPAHRVAALEVDWSAIVGLDYRCPLHDDGKLVLEARQVVKRCFKSVEDVRDFYSPRAASVTTGASLRSFHSGAPAPKLSFEGWQRPATSGRTIAAGSVLLSPRFARPVRTECAQSTAESELVRPTSLAEVAALAVRPGVATVREPSTHGTCSSANGQGGLRSERRDLRSPPQHYGVPSRTASANRMSRAGGAAANGASSDKGRMRRVVSFADGSSGCSGFASADEGTGGHRWQAASAAETITVGSGVGALSSPAQAGGGRTAQECGNEEGGIDRTTTTGRRLRQPRLGGGGGLCADQDCRAPTDKPFGHAAVGRQPHQNSDAMPRRVRSTDDLCGIADDRASEPQLPQAPVSAAAGRQSAGSSSRRTWNGMASDSAECRVAGAASCPGCSTCLGVNGNAAAGCGGCGATANVSCGCRCVCCRRRAARRGWVTASDWQGSHSAADTSAECNSSSIWGRAAAACVSGAGTDAVMPPRFGSVGSATPMQPAKVEFGRRVRNGGRTVGGVGTDAGATCAGGLGGSGGVDAQVPRTSRWTRPTATYYSSTLVLGFRDPFLPQELRRFVKSDMRLLKLYESGLPAWAIFLPSYGLPYRPWLRRALWLLFIAISVFSMGCGFYDLYKNVPFLKQVVTAVASRMYLPASELFEWLERHTQIRMSILLTYLFSKSPLLMSLMRMLRSLAALLQQLLQPVASAASVALRPLGAAFQAAASGICGGAAAAAAAVWQVLQPGVAAAAACGREVAELGAAVLGPPARALGALLALLAHLARLVAALVGMVLVGPLQLAGSVAGALSWAGSAAVEQLAVAWEAVAWGLQSLVTLGRAAQRVAPALTAVKAGARVAAQTASSTAVVASGGAGGVSGGMAVWQWLGLEVVGAYNAVRMTFIQAFKSAQAVMNFLVTVANTAVQHRVSLLLQIRRFITRQKERLPPAVAASVPLPSLLSMPSFDMPTPAPSHMPGLLDSERNDEDADLDPTSSAMAIHHPVFDLDMVLMEDDTEQHGGVLLGAMVSEHAGPEQPQRDPYAAMFPGDGARGESDGRSTQPAPIPIPAQQRGRSFSSSAGLRRRQVSGGSASAASGHGGGLGVADAAAGSVGVKYSFSYGRLDAVDEEQQDELSYLDGSGSLAGADAEGFPVVAGGVRARSLPGRSHALGAGGTDAPGVGASLGSSAERQRPAWPSMEPDRDKVGQWSASAPGPGHGFGAGRLGKKQRRRQQQQQQQQAPGLAAAVAGDAHGKAQKAAGAGLGPAAAGDRLRGAGEHSLAPGAPQRPASSASGESCSVAHRGAGCAAALRASPAAEDCWKGAVGGDQQHRQCGSGGGESQQPRLASATTRCSGSGGPVASDCAGHPGPFPSHVADKAGGACTAAGGKAGEGGDTAGGLEGNPTGAVAARRGTAGRSPGAGGANGIGGSGGSGGPGGVEGSNSACGLRSCVSPSQAARHPVIRAS